MGGGEVPISYMEISLFCSFSFSASENQHGDQNMGRRGVGEGRMGIGEGQERGRMGTGEG